MAQILDNLKLTIAGIPDEEAAIEFFQQMDLVPTPDDALRAHCVECGSPMTVVSKMDTKLKWRLRCTSNTNHTASPLTGTFFERVKLPFVKILSLLFCFVMKGNLSIEMVKGIYFANSTYIYDLHLIEIADVSPPLISQWWYYMREVCQCYIDDNPVVIGGPGLTVEIDESVYNRRKYGRGRKKKPLWILGAVCVENKDQIAVERVENRMIHTIDYFIRR